MPQKVPIRSQGKDFAPRVVRRRRTVVDDTKRSVSEEATERMLGDLERSEEVVSSWEALLEEMETNEEELADDGWDTLAFYPGHISTVTDTDMFGLHVLVPNNQFDDLAAIIDKGATFDAFQIYTNASDERVYALLIVMDTTAETAVLYPVQYLVDKETLLSVEARDREQMLTRLRNINEDVITFTHDPDAFFSK